MKLLIRISCIVSISAGGGGQLVSTLPSIAITAHNMSIAGHMITYMGIAGHMITHMGIAGHMIMHMGIAGHMITHMGIARDYVVLLLP